MQQNPLHCCLRLAFRLFFNIHYLPILIIFSQVQHKERRAENSVFAPLFLSYQIISAQTRHVPVLLFQNDQPQLETLDVRLLTVHDEADNLALPLYFFLDVVRDQAEFVDSGTADDFFTGVVIRGSTRCLLAVVAKTQSNKGRTTLKLLFGSA